MSDPLEPTMDNKLNDLNKKIVEIKKKIQLSGKPISSLMKRKSWKIVKNI